MKSTLRPTSIDDLPVLREFVARAFGDDPGAPFLDPAMMSWKYWDRRDDWTEPRGYVLERDGVIVAHAGIWPMTFGTGADRVRGIQMIDWTAAKESPGSGVALVQKLTTMFDFIYSIGGSEITRKVLPAFGFTEYARQWHGARPLRPLRQMLTHQTPNWKLAPKLARNYWWALPKGRNPAKNWKAIELQPQAISPAASLSDMTAARSSPRSSAFFEYLLRCPAARVSVYGIVNGDELQGHFAISVVRGQARLAGIWLREPSREGWTATFFLAQQAARRLKGANEIVAAGVDGISAESAAQAGFQIRQGPPVYLLNKKGKLSLPADFQFQIVDDDGVFLDTGKPDYWT
jgi:hypothetical protein